MFAFCVSRRAFPNCVRFIGGGALCLLSASHGVLSQIVCRLLAAVLCVCFLRLTTCFPKLCAVYWRRCFVFAFCVSRRAFPNCVRQKKLAALMKEIEEEEKAQVIRLGDASVASPFTSKLSTVMSGKCTRMVWRVCLCMCVCLVFFFFGGTKDAEKSQSSVRLKRSGEQVNTPYTQRPPDSQKRDCFIVCLFQCVASSSRRGAQCTLVTTLQIFPKKPPLVP